MQNDFDASTTHVRRASRENCRVCYAMYRLYHDKNMVCVIGASCKSIALPRWHIDELSVIDGHLLLSYAAASVAILSHNGEHSNEATCVCVALLLYVAVQLSAGMLW